MRLRDELVVEAHVDSAQIVELADLFVRQRQRQGAEIVVEMFSRASAQNCARDAPACDEPREGNLCG